MLVLLWHAAVICPKILSMKPFDWKHVRYGIEMKMVTHKTFGITKHYQKEKKIIQKGER